MKIIKEMPIISLAKLELDKQNDLKTFKQILKYAESKEFGGVSSLADDSQKILDDIYKYIKKILTTSLKVWIYKQKLMICGNLSPRGAKDVVIQQEQLLKIVSLIKYQATKK